MPWYISPFFIAGGILVVASFVWGGWPERMIASTNLSAAIATWLVRPRHASFQQFEPQIAVIDLLVTAIYLWVALRSDRWWPSVVAALMAPTLIAHLGIMLNPKLRANGYALVGLTTYPVPVVIAIGIARAHRRRLAAPTSPTFSTTRE